MRSHGPSCWSSVCLGLVSAFPGSVLHRLLLYSPPPSSRSCTWASCVFSAGLWSFVDPHAGCCSAGSTSFILGVTLRTLLTAAVGAALTSHERSFHSKSRFSRRFSSRSSHLWPPGGSDSLLPLSAWPTYRSLVLFSAGDVCLVTPSVTFRLALVHALTLPLPDLYLLHC